MGTSAEHMSRLDRLVALPLYGRADSLNLSTAAAVFCTSPPRPNAPQSPVTKRRGSVRPSFLDCPRRTVRHSPPAREPCPGRTLTTTPFRSHR